MSKLIYILFILIVVQVQAQEEMPPVSPDSLVKTANKYLKVSYKYAGKDPSGFDCSGFVGFIFNQFGVSLPSSSLQMSEVGNVVSIKDAKQGDLIFFKGHDITSGVGHVGIVVSNLNKITWIHASTSHGVRYDTFDNQYFKERFVTIKRIIN